MHYKFKCNQNYGFLLKLFIIYIHYYKHWQTLYTLGLWPEIKVSIPGGAIPKTQKMVIDATIRVKGKSSR